MLDVIDQAARQRFSQAHREDCLALLESMWRELKEAQPEHWRMLRFNGPAAAAAWSLEQWEGSSFAPETAGWPAELLPPGHATFVLLEFWELYRLCHLQKQEFLSDDKVKPFRTRAVGQSHREILLSALSSPMVKDTDDTERESALPNLVDLLAQHQLTTQLRPALTIILRAVENTLEQVARIHPALRVLWLERHRRVRDYCHVLFEASHFVDGAQALYPPILNTLARTERSKAAALGLFRFLILYEPLSLDHHQATDEALRESLLTSVEDPDWPLTPRTRWDVVPKAVVASRLKARGFQLTSNQVAEATRNRLGLLVTEYLHQQRHRLAALDTRLTVAEAFVLLLRLVLARDSIHLTLRDEYARSDRDGTTGPSSAVLRDWHDELDSAIEELHLYLDTRRSL